MTAKKTLDDQEIQTRHDEGDGEPRSTRRSMLGAVGGLVAGGAVAAVLPGCYRRAVVVGPRAPGAVVVTSGGGCSGVTDSDLGRYSDPVNCGRGGGRGACSGQSDSDGGAYADPGGCGRGGYRTSGVTDSDGGPYADPAGNGRGRYR